MISLFWGSIEEKRKREVYLLSVLLIIAAISEVFTIGAIVPFVSLLSKPDREGNFLLMELSNLTGISDDRELLMLLICIFACATIFVGYVRILLLRHQTYLGHKIGADISFLIYKKTMSQSYEVHVNRNSSQIIAAVTTKVDSLVNNGLLPVLYFISSMFMILFILGALLIIEPYMTILVIFSFVLIYGGFVIFTRKRLEKNSKEINKQTNAVVKTLQEGLGGIRDVILDRTQDTFSQIFISKDRPRRAAIASVQIISISPRYVIESLGLFAFAVFALYFVFTGMSFDAALPAISAIAIGAQRMLPMLQQVYRSITQIKGARHVIKEVASLLAQPVPENRSITSKIEFEEKIEFQNLYYSYNGQQPWILNNINLVIKKGTKIGIIGTTGSGKSTFIDVLMGLLSAVKGTLKIDNTIIESSNVSGWYDYISHVPQDIYLSDATVFENIAFGISYENIDKSAVIAAAEAAKVNETILNLKNGYDTTIGERGVKLSGGQRQRLGIARALYRNAGVLVLDEATSALDAFTEESVIKEIEKQGNNLTLIMIAHRTSTLKSCDTIVEFENGSIKRVITPGEL